MTILIADDHKIVRIGLASLIKEEYPQSEILEAGSGSEVYKHLQNHSFEIMLMDLNMPDTDGMAMLQQSLKLNASLKVLIVSMNPEKLFAMRYLKAGAAGYVEKNKDEVTIKKAIKTVINGKIYLSAEMVEVMSQYVRTGNALNPFDKLSKREFEVAMLCIKGVTSGEIGRVLAIQSPTVSIYKSRIFEKLNIKSTHDLLEMAKQYEIF